MSVAIDRSKYYLHSEIITESGVVRNWRPILTDEEREQAHQTFLAQLRTLYPTLKRVYDEDETFRKEIDEMEAEENGSC